jgi:outer membrane receptor protein involved in Fe transport
MNKIYLLLAFVMCFSFAAADAQTTLEGQVTDIETGEPILFGNVALYRGGNMVTGTQTDFDGNYSFNNIDPGTYDVEVSYVGYQSQRQSGVVVSAGRANRLNIELSSGVMMDEIEVIDYVVPLIEQDNTTSGGTLTGDQIRNLPIKDISALAATTAGLARQDGSDDINIRGSRSDATDYYIDGMRVSGRLIPQSEIEQMQVLTGGIPANYGDVSGGVISLTTRGPSSEFAGGVEIESSEFLDAFGYNLVSGNFSGPLLRSRQDTTQSIIGFRVSGQLLYQRDNRPTFTGWYQMSPDAVKELENDPIRFVGTTPFPRAEDARFEEAGGDIEFRDIRRNNMRRDIDITARIDARLSDNVDLSFTGSYSDRKDQFTPGGWAMFNHGRNPFEYSDVMRGTFRLRHRLGVQSRDLSDEDRQQRSNQLIRNAVYTIQASFQRRTDLLEDQVHQDNFWRYGYVGEFGVNWVPIINTPRDGQDAFSGGLPTEFGDTLQHTGYNRQFAGMYNPNMDINPVLANYNKGFLEINEPGQVTDFYAYNGNRVGFLGSSYGMFANVGTVYNTYQERERDRYSVDLRTSFEFLPGGSERGRHNIEIGLYYEQRVNRSWRLNPNRLWDIARLRANTHIIDVDTNNIIGQFTQDGFFDPNNPNELFLFDEFQNEIVDQPGRFYRAVRELRGESLNRHFNTDKLHPDELDIDMFSPFELTDQNLIGYHGYTFTGDKVSSSLSFEDFWNTDEDGNRTWDVAPFRPNYLAFYIQDRFTFRDIIFRLGLRMDRYDANTKVMRDPFSLYEVMSADDFYTIQEDIIRPDGVRDNFKVYTAGEESNAVVAFREGEQWYDETGNPVNDGNVIFGGGVVTPYLTDFDENIKSADFDVNRSFEDYKPQVNWMPRLAFSFPISDDANFFAHYDILVQRPTSNNFVSPLQYYYFEDAGRTPNANPNLRPEKTIDYEVGFQQRLTNSSAIKIAAYYKEIRDQIQVRNLLFVASPVGQYETFGNLDFGTVKGFSFQYDLRRTNNLQMVASYTLQFADGTGSSPTSQRGLTSRGNLRALSPLSFDERHRFVVNLDYRYGSGRRYNGPRLGGFDILENTGVNVQATAVSGRPYTRTLRPTRFGGDGFAGTLNGSRLPWSFYLDGRIDRSFTLTPGGGEGDSRPIFLNIYLRVENILNTRNILGVYSFTGSAEDSGWLNSSFGRDNIAQLKNDREGGVPAGTEELPFLEQYQASSLAPGFFALPRRVYLGAIIEF